MVACQVRFHTEFEALAKSEQDEMLAYAKLLNSCAATRTAYRVKILNGSRRVNLKELRFVVENG